MRRIGLRRRARHRGARVGDQPPDQRGRPRRRGDELARARAQPQAELQHVERVLRIAPFGELVAPGGIELRPAQALRVLGGKRLRDRAILPFEPPPRGRPHRPLPPRAEPHQAGLALDHHLAHVMLALADQRDAPMRRIGVRRDPQRQRAHKLGAEPRLAGAAPAERKPCGPRRAIVGRKPAAPDARARARRNRQRAGASAPSPAPPAPAPSARLATNASMRRARSRRTSSMSAAVVVMVVGLRRAAEAQAAQLGERFGENGERARGALGIGRPQRLGAEARAHRLDGGELLEHRGFKPRDRGGVGRRSRVRPSPRSVLALPPLARGRVGVGVASVSMIPTRLASLADLPFSRGGKAAPANHPPAWRAASPAKARAGAARPPAAPSRSGAPDARARSCRCRNRSRSTWCFASYSRCAASPRRGIRACSA